jgi:probable F420-dependent oxidoreductase
MKVETLLPLGKVDPGLRAPEQPLDLQRVAADAALVEGLGYDGLMTEETKDDPFVIMALAAPATRRIQLGTAVTIAFARSPTSMAMSAWSLQKLSHGRFTLGLGPQVRAHIARRFGMPTHPAGPWMREYIQTVRALWDTWQNGTPLRVEGRFYNIDLVVPLFNPGPLAKPVIPIHLAAVNRVMCQVAGEMADGIRPHPVCTPDYIREVMMQEVRVGALRSGRSLHGFTVAMKPLVATAIDEEQLQPRIRDARARIAFYASTPAYAAAFEYHGLGDLVAEAKLLSRAQQWEALPGLIDDTVLHLFVTIGTYGEIGQRLINRYAGVVTHVEFSIPVFNETDHTTLARLVKDLQVAGKGPTDHAINHATP